MSNPIIESALSDRIQTCIAAGLCECNELDISPTCPCHTVQGIALNSIEAELAPNIININRSEQENSE